MSGVQAVTGRIAEIEARIAALVGGPGGGGVVGSQHAAAFSSQLRSARADAAAPPSAPPTGRTAAAARPATPASSADWVARLPERGRAWSGEVEQAAVRHGVDPALLASLVWTESGFDPAAESHAGAIGLAQLMPATAAGLGVDPHDPAANLDGGARFLRAQLDRFGSVELALAAYNAGPGRVAQAGGIPRIPETQAYVPTVLGHYDQLKGRA